MGNSLEIVWSKEYVSCKYRLDGDEMRVGYRAAAVVFAVLLVTAAGGDSIVAGFGTGDLYPNSEPNTPDPNVESDENIGWHNGSLRSISLETTVHYRVSGKDRVHPRSALSIREATEPAFRSASVRDAALSPPIRVSYPDNIQSASVTIGYGPSGGLDVSDSSIFYYDRELQTFIRLDSSHDAISRTFSANVTALGTFIIMSESRWADTFNRSAPSGQDEVNISTSSTDSYSMFVPQASALSLEADLVAPVSENAPTAKLVVTGSESGNRETYRVQVNNEASRRMGDEQLQQNISKFSGERITLTATAEGDADLVFTDLRIRADSDQDGLTDSTEAGGIRAGTKWIYTDPYDADTDGDGVSDGQEIYVLDSGQYGDYYRLTSDPSHSDTDRDGLSDFTERDLDRTIRVVESPTERFSIRRANSDREQDLSGNERIISRSDPMSSDTDLDGIPDGREIQLGTDPTSGDSDSDLLSDHAESLGYRSENSVRQSIGSESISDPTLADSQPPEVVAAFITSRQRWWRLSTEYTVHYALLDEAGVSEISVTDHGEAVYVEQLDGYDTHYFGNATYTAGWFSDPQIEISAVDRNGNRVETIDLRAPVEVDQTSGETPSILTQEYQSGFKSGIAAALGDYVVETIEAPQETARLLGAIITDPTGVWNDTQEIVDFLLERESLSILAEQYDARLEKQQAEANPHRLSTKAYDSYRTGWKEGYLFTLALTSITPYAASKIGKVGKGSQIITRLDDLPLKTKILRRAEGVSRAVIDTQWRPTRRYQVSRLQRKLEVESFADLEQARPDDIAEFLLRGGDEGAEALNRHRGIRLILNDQDGDVPSELRTDTALHLARISDRSDISAADIDRISYRLRTTHSDRETLYRLIANDNHRGDAAQFVGAASEGDLRQFLSLSRVEGIDASELQTVARTAGATGGDVPFAALRRNFDSVNEIHYTAHSTVTTGRRHGITTTVRTVGDPDSFLRTHSELDDVHEFSRLDSGARGTIAETQIAPEIARQKGYTVLYGQGDAARDGIDLIARDRTSGKVVVFEVKYTSSDRTIGPGLFRSSRSTVDGRVDQMTDGWIEHSFRSRVSADDIVRDQYDTVDVAIERGDYRKEVIAVQTGGSGRTVSPRLRSRYGIDAVDIVRLDEL